MSLYFEFLDVTTEAVTVDTINDFNIEKQLEDFRWTKKGRELGWGNFVKFEVTDKKNQECGSFCDYKSLSDGQYYLHRKEAYKNGKLDGHQMQRVYDIDNGDGRMDSYYVDGKCQTEHTTYFNGVEIRRSLNTNENEHGIQTSYAVKGKKNATLVNDGEKDTPLSKTINQKLKYIRFADNLRFLFSNDHMSPQERFQHQVRKATNGLNI